MSTKNEELTTKNGLLYLNGVELDAAHADIYARARGFLFAEGLVAHLAKQQVEHASRGHHPYSPSTLQAREASPCYKPTSGKSNKASQRGTAQHEAVDTGVVEDHLTDEEAAAVAMAMDALDEAERVLGPDAAVLREQYMPVDDAVHDVDGEEWRGTTAGYADACVYSVARKRGHVLDWKFGKFAVEPSANNLQGIAYALGLWKHVAENHGVVLDEVRVTFISPHIEERSDAIFKKEQINDLLLRVKTVVSRSQYVDNLLGRSEHPSVSQWTAAERMVLPTTSACMFCARIATCPKVASVALNQSKKYAPVEFPEGVDIRGFGLDQPAAASKALQVAKVCERWAKEFRGRVTELAFKDEHFVPEGFRLMATWPRKVLDVSKLYEKVRARLGDEKVWQMMDLPLTVVEDALKESAPRGTKTTVVEEFSAELEAEGIVEKSTTPVVSLRMKSGSNKQTANNQ